MVAICSNRTEFGYGMGNLVNQVGSIEIEQGRSLVEQIAVNEQRAKALKEIARLEAMARKEKQAKKKFEIVSQITALKKRKGGVY